MPKGQYDRSVRRTPLKQRFYAKVLLPSGQLGCMEWDGSRQANGYGKFHLGTSRNKSVLAHRVSWELANGPIPDTLVIDHLCRNKGCVAVEHLEPVGQSTNVKRGTRWT